MYVGFKPKLRDLFTLPYMYMKWFTRLSLI